MGSEMGEGFDVAVVGASSAAGAGVRPVGDTEASDALMSTVPALSLRMNHRRQSRAARRMQLAHVSVYVAVWPIDPSAPYWAWRNRLLDGTTDERLELLTSLHRTAHKHARTSIAWRPERWLTANDFRGNIKQCKH